MLEKIKKLREETEAPILECKKALQKSGGDLELAKKYLKQWQKEFVKKEKKSKASIVDVYLHPNRKIGVLVEVSAETDFVTKNPEFQNLVHEICLQIASMSPKNIEDLLEQNWIRDENLKIKELLKLHSQKFGEKIEIERFERYEC
jgi:elongation factor Ts